MPDRFDYSKGRYVPYTYAAKGDRFTRGLTPAPPVFVTVHAASGPRRRRLRTTEAKPVRVRDVLEKFREGLPPERRRGDGLARLLELTTFTYDATAHRLHLTVPGQDAPEGVRLALESTAQRLGGVRWWWACPRCSRRTTTVYGVSGGGGSSPAWSAVGCRACLGLTYPSQALHKTQAFDRQLLERGGKGASFQAWWRANRRELERWRKIGARFGITPPT